MKNQPDSASIPHLGTETLEGKELGTHNQGSAGDEGARTRTGKIGSSKHGSAMDAVKQTDGVNDKSKLQANSPGQELHMSFGSRDSEEASTARGHSQSRHR